MVFQPEFKGKRKLMSQIQDSKTERNSYFLLLFSCPVVSDSLWPHTAGPQAFLSLAISRSLWWEDQVHVHCICDAIQPSHPLMPFSPSALNLSQAEELFQWASVRIRWPKYWSFSFASVLPVNIQGVSPIRSTGFIFLLSRGLSNIWVPHGPVKLTITGV